MKLTSLFAATPTRMNDDKGDAYPLVGPEDGASNVDVHVNVIASEAPAFPYHFHEHAENVYVVLDGVAALIIDGVRYRVGKDEVVFIPPGVPHAAGGAGEGDVTLLELYAPAGPDFHRLPLPDNIIDA